MTARCLTIELEPEDAAVFSRSAATLGAHATLAGPPGAALMGWAARKCYPKLSEEGQKLVFHSGRVRFSDAVRFEGGKPRFVNPAILFEPKHGGGKAVLGRNAFQQANPGSQAETVKGLWISHDGEIAPSPRFRRRMRTAMSNGQAAQGQLFGYQAVDPAGMLYRATVECAADELTQDDWDELTAAFACGTLRLGRARASGYGGTYGCSIIENAEPLWPKANVAPGNREIRFWLLSDALLLNEWGAPKAGFEAGDFGLGLGWHLLPDETAVSMRRAWPWNFTTGSRDVELPLVEAGSVVSFRWEGAGDAPQVDFPAVIGSRHQRGLGRVGVLPQGFAIAEAKESHGAANSSKLPEPQTSLVRWAKARAGALDDGCQLPWELERIGIVLRLIERAGPSGPSPSQWSRLSDLADELAQGAIANWRDELRDDGWRANLAGLDGWVRTDLFALPDGESHLSMRPYIKRVIKAARAGAQGARR